MKNIIVILILCISNYVVGQNVDIRINKTDAELIMPKEEGILSNTHFKIDNIYYIHIGMELEQLGDTIKIPLKSIGPIEEFYVSINGEDRTGKILPGIDFKTTYMVWSPIYQQWVINRFGTTYDVFGRELN